MTSRGYHGSKPVTVATNVFASDKLVKHLGCASFKHSCRLEKVSGLPTFAGLEDAYEYMLRNKGGSSKEGGGLLPRYAGFGHVSLHTYAGVPHSTSMQEIDDVRDFLLSLVPAESAPTPSRLAPPDNDPSKS